MKISTMMLPLVVLLGACVTRFGDDTQGVTVRQGQVVVLRTVAVPPDTACPAGGSRILFGHDVDGDGVLGAAEESGQHVVCAGAAGDRGLDGDAGPPGRDGLPAVDNCTAGQRLAFNVDGGSWVCHDDADALAGFTCPASAMAGWDGTRWTCVPDGAGPNTLDGLDCAQGVSGQVARFDGTSWRCDLERDSDILGLVACTAPGEVLTWDGSGWTCDTQVDEDTFGALRCLQGHVARWSGTRWECAFDAVASPGVNTLGSLTCPPGQLAKWNGAAWACAVDVDEAPNCVPGQMPVWAAGAWRCITDADTDTLAALACAPGQVPKRRGAAWVCDSDDNAPGLVCADQQVVRWSGAGWVCSADADTNTLGGLTCQPGEVAKWNGTAWQCASDAVATAGSDTLAALGCAAGQLARFNGVSWVCAQDDNALAFSCGVGELARWSGTGWSCAADVDTNTLATLSCGTGELARYNGSAWVCAPDANALAVTCASSQVPVWNGSGWTCGADADSDTLATLTCSNGQLARYNGVTWACAADANTLTITCTNGQVPKWSGVGWACGVDQDANTLGALACGNGQLAKHNGSAWACAADDNALSVTCSNGEVARWSGSGWICSADVDNDTLATLSCANGQVARFNGVTWACAVDANALGVTCSNGQVPKWSGTGWACNADLDSDTLGALSCGNGQLAKWNGTAWACAVDANVFAASCANGQVLKWSGAGWACAADDNQDTLAALACGAGQLARWNGSAWACSTDNNGVSLSCANGQVPKWSGAAWTCAGDSDAVAALGCANGEVPKVVGGVFNCEPDNNVLGNLNCTNGQVPKRAGGAWACAADNTGAAAVFARTVVVSPGATPLESGTTLRNVLNGLAPTAAEPVRVLLEPGVFDVGAIAVAIPEFVTLEGAGRHATTVQSTGNTLVSVGNVEIRNLRVVAAGGAVTALTDGAFVAAPYVVRGVTVEVTSSAGFARGFEVSTTHPDLEDVDITIQGTAAASACEGLMFFNAARSSLRKVRVTITNCRHSAGMRAQNSGSTGVAWMRNVDIVAVGGVDQTYGLQVASHARAVLEHVTVRTESVQITAAESPDHGIAVAATDIALNNVRVDVGGIRAGTGVSVTGTTVARDVDVVTNGTGATGILGVALGFRSDVDGMRIRQRGNSTYGLTSTVGGGWARMRHVDIDQAGGTGIYNGVLATSMTFAHGSIRGSTNAAVVNSGVLEVFSSVMGGAVPAASALFRCISTYSVGYARLASCTY